MQLKRMYVNVGMALSIFGTFFPSTTYAKTLDEDTVKADAVDEKDNGANLQSVIVTSSKRNESIQTVPTAITAISGKSITDSGNGKTAGEILNSIPNASAATLSSHLQPRWFIRGLGTGDPGGNVVSPIGVYIDEVYLTNIVAGGFPLFDLERVEVLRGSQGTLWGKNTTGGAIHFISKKPTFDNDGYAKVELGSYDQQTIQAASSLELVKDTLALRASVYQDSRDGYSKNINDGGDRGGLRDSAIRLQFLANISDKLEALLNVHARDLNSDEYATNVFGTSPNRVFAGSVYPTYSRDIRNNAKPKVDLDGKGLSLNFKYQLGKNELTSITAYENTEYTQLGDADATAREISRSYGQTRSRQVSQEFRLVSPREDRVNWIGGIHLFRENLDIDSARAALPNSNDTAQVYQDSILKQTTTSYAAFGSVTFDLTSDFKLTGGLRYTSEEKDIDLNRVATTAGGTVFGNTASWWKRSSIVKTLSTVATQDEANSWNEWTYDVTPEYRLSDNARVYAKYSKGFRSGGYNGGATTQSSVSVLDPEYLKAYELGIKSEVFNGRANINASIFYYDYKDVQVNTVLASPTGTVSTQLNGASADAYGAELEVEALPLDRLHVFSSIGLLKAQYKDYKTATADYSGNDFGRSPRLTAAIGGDYRIPLENGASLVLSTDWYGKSKFYFSTSAQSDYEQGQKGYVVGNAQISYVTPKDKLKISLFAKNLTDRDYLTAINPGVTGLNTYVLGDPRTVGVSVTTRW